MSRDPQHQEPQTLARFIMEEERRFPDATGDFSNLLSHLSLAGKVIQRQVSKAGLVDILGHTGQTNVQGETVQKLDLYANDIIIRMFERSGALCALASEEEEDIVPMAADVPTGDYVMSFDPLDGSSNIDANINIGTIFSIHHRITEQGPGTTEDFLQAGSRQLCAGYILYGSATMLIMSTGNGVHGFTLDPGIGEFLLSHRDLRMPERGKIYSTNEGNSAHWLPGTRAYIDHLKSVDKDRGLPYKARYIGSLVADFHRTLLYGGIFLYPGDQKAPNGKLRLLYEASPLAFLAQQAGGHASTGEQAILDIEPESLHQRVPLIIGSREDVEEAERFHRGPGNSG